MTGLTQQAKPILCPGDDLHSFRVDKNLASINWAPLSAIEQAEAEAEELHSIDTRRVRLVFVEQGQRAHFLRMPTEYYEHYARERAELEDAHNQSYVRPEDRIPQDFLKKNAQGRPAMNIVPGPGRMSFRVADEIAQDLGVVTLNVTLGIQDDGDAKFACENVRGQDLTIIYENSTLENAAHLKQLEAMVDAFRRAGAEKLTLAASKFPGDRGDRRTRAGGEYGKRTPIIAKANLASLTRWNNREGIGQFIVLDPHDSRIEGFCDSPFEAICLWRGFFEAALEAFPELGEGFGLMYADKGAVGRGEENQFNHHQTLLDIFNRVPEINSLIKYRLPLLDGSVDTSRTTITDKTTVKGLDWIAIDELIAGSQTMQSGVTRIKSEGGRKAYVFVTHAQGLREGLRALGQAVFIRDGVPEPLIDGLFISDTVYAPWPSMRQDPTGVTKEWSKWIHRLSHVPMMTAAIAQLNGKAPCSLSELSISRYPARPRYGKTFY